MTRPPSASLEPDNHYRGSGMKLAGVLLFFLSLATGLGMLFLFDPTIASLPVWDGERLSDGARVANLSRLQTQTLVSQWSMVGVLISALLYAAGAIVLVAREPLDATCKDDGPKPFQKPAETPAPTD